MTTFSIAAMYQKVFRLFKIPTTFCVKSRDVGFSKVIEKVVFVEKPTMSGFDIYPPNRHTSNPLITWVMQLSEEKSQSHQYKFENLRSR